MMFEKYIESRMRIRGVTEYLADYYIIRITDLASATYQLNLHNQYLYVTYPHNNLIMTVDQLPPTLHFSLWEFVEVISDIGRWDYGSAFYDIEHSGSVVITTSGNFQMWGYNGGPFEPLLCFIRINPLAYATSDTYNRTN
jgi:hypothetical protein